MKLFVTAFSMTWLILFMLDAMTYSRTGKTYYVLITAVSFFLACAAWGILE